MILWSYCNSNVVGVVRKLDLGWGGSSKKPKPKTVKKKPKKPRKTGFFYLKLHRHKISRHTFLLYTKNFSFSSLTSNIYNNTKIQVTR